MDYDLCIVGSGAGAGPIAYELCRAGFKVLILEKGPWYEKKDFFKDEIAVCRRSTFTPRLDLEQHVIETQEGTAWVTTPTSESGWDFWNGSMVGGSSNLMSGYFHRLKPKDFKLKSNYGEIAGVNIEDWPISYEDLEPYYEKVERVVGVSGVVVDHPFQEPRSTADFPYPKVEESGVSAWFDAAARKLGLASIPTPRAILSVAKGARNACEYSGYCGSYGCSSGAKGSAREALLHPALETGNLEIRPHAFVKKIHSDAKRVTFAEYLDKSGVSHKVEAKLFVVAAQAIETARLLLNSANRFFPKGLANNSGQVGKNLIFSSGGNGSGTFYYDDFVDEDAAKIKRVGPFVNRSLQDWYEIKEHGATLKGGTIDFLFEHPNAVPRAKSVMYEGDIVWGDALKKRLIERFTKQRVFNFELFCDWTPNDECFVTLDEKIKDRWGMPVAKVRVGIHPHDLKISEMIRTKTEAILKEMGAKDISSFVSDLPPQNLQGGGCRFGIDPKKSVLDPQCRTHELENLYISDGSFMPTGGSVPFTWTIYANAFRVADAIKKALS